MGWGHSTGCSLESGVAGDFHRPYEGRVPFIGVHSLKEGAGDGWCHSTGYSLESGGTGDFHRPYEGGESGMGVV